MKQFLKKLLLHIGFGITCIPLFLGFLVLSNDYPKEKIHIIIVSQITCIAIGVFLMCISNEINK